MTGSDSRLSGLLSGYDRGGFYDELFGGRGNTAPHAALIRERLSALEFDDIRRRSDDAAHEL